MVDDQQLAWLLAREAGRRLLALRGSGDVPAEALRNAGDRQSHVYLMAELARLRPGDAVLPSSSGLCCCFPAARILS